ncbi:MAG: agmatinase [Candidatus Bathyarchaeia archaeon]|nr:agmatinase [Candidatus Bathyarchaeota archaeon]
MSKVNLFISPTLFFSGYQREFRDAEYIIFGVPFDATSTYRSGARFAPTAIREASLNIETYSFRSGVDLEDLKIHDAGDLHVSGNISETLRRIGIVCREILEEGKMPVMIGGEHTITFGAAKGINGNFAIISFDAHLDLRDEYMGEKFSHATFLRRINEEIKPRRIIVVGVRAACREELKYVSESGNIKYITSQKIIRDGAEGALKDMRVFLYDCDKLYVTIDMDVLDPSFAPAVQNPEPEGVSITALLDMLLGICDTRLAMFDLVEVTPHYDNGITAVSAAKIIFELLMHHYKVRKR